MRLQFNMRFPTSQAPGESFIKELLYFLRLPAVSEGDELLLKTGEALFDGKRDKVLKFENTSKQ